MMKIYGASDDLVEIEGHEAAEKIGCYDAQVKIDIGDGKGGVRVVMLYGVSGACWSAEIAPWDYEVPMPWPVRVKAKGYSAVVEIDCPADVPLKTENLYRAEARLRAEHDGLKGASEFWKKRVAQLEADLKLKTIALTEILKVRNV